MDIQLKVNNRTVKAYQALPASGRGPGILVLHAWWGLKPFFKQFCDRLARQGYTVLAPDLRQGQIAKTVDEAKALMEKSDSQLTGEIVMAAKDFLLAHSSCTTDKLGVVGFSMGAGWSLVLASSAPEKVAATVLFYGADLVEVGKIKSKIIGHFSDVDEWEPYDQIQGLERKMKESGVDVTFYTYPGLAHWFFEEDRPEFDHDAAKLAWERSLAFLKKEL